MLEDNYHSTPVRLRIGMMNNDLRSTKHQNEKNVRVNIATAQKARTRPNEGSGEREIIPAGSSFTLIPRSISFPFPLSFLVNLACSLMAGGTESSHPGKEFARDIDTEGSSDSGCTGNESESGRGGTLGWREGGMSVGAGSDTGRDTGRLMLAPPLFKFLALAR